MAMKIKTVEQLDNGFVFHWKNGKHSTYLIDDLSEEMIRRHAIFGMQTRYQNTHASAEQKGMSIDDCIVAADELHAAVKRGEWSEGRAATGGWIVDWLFTLDRFESREEALTFWQGLPEDSDDPDDVTQKVLRKDPQAVAWYRAKQAAEAARKASGKTSNLDKLFDKSIPRRRSSSKISA